MKMFLKTINFIVISINFLFAISFAKIYGGRYGDYAFSIQQTNDGGYIVAGWTGSFGAGDDDFLVIKLDSNGNIEWSKTFGGSNWEEAHSIHQTTDGGYIVAGFTASFGVGNFDFLVIKLDSNGNIEWSKTFGGSNADYAHSIQQTNDGGYIVGGSTKSFGAGYHDFLVIKLDSNGNIVWSKTLGGSHEDAAYSIQETSDGGYIIAGNTYSFGTGYYDFLVIKLDSNGNIVWSKTFGGSVEWGEFAYSIQETSDGGYIVAGNTWGLGAGYYDFLVIKLNSNGDIQWSKTFGGGDWDEARSIHQTTDGGYIVAGYTDSFGGGEHDVLVIKLNSNGSIEWAKTFGVGWGEVANSIQQASDGGYIVAGSYHGDFLIIKTQDGNMASNCPWYNCNPIATSPNISTSSPSIYVTSPHLTTTSPSISISSPPGSTIEICSTLLAQENIYFPEIIKLFSSTFLKDKISLIFSGYSKEKIKIILYDVLGNEIISKTFDFKNYIEIKDKRIEKIKKGIYFLKIYLKGKEIGSLKIIK